MAAPPALLLALASPAACTTTISPPRAPSDPVEVFIVDYGMTSAVVLPRDGALAPYVYGDWQYYALENNKALQGIAALTWPTQGTLGRGRLEGPATEAALLSQLQQRGAERVLALRVERSQAHELVERLDAVYHAHQAEEVQNESYRMGFVPHPQRYTWFWNSNHQTAAWLEELGCEIRGPAFAARWRIEEARR